MKKNYLASFALIATLTLFLSGCSQGCPTVTDVCPDGSTPFQNPDTCEIAECPEPPVNTEPSFIECDPAIVGVEGACTMEYAPVCGNNGQEYGNGCQACRGGASTYMVGSCTTGDVGI